MRPIAESGRPIYLLGESLGGMLALYGVRRAIARPVPIPPRSSPRCVVKT